MERNNKYISTEARILELFIGVFTVCSHQRACNFSTDSCKHCKHTDEKFWKASVLIYICSVVYFHLKCIYIYIYTIAILWVLYISFFLTEDWMVWLWHFLVNMHIYILLRLNPSTLWWLGGMMVWVILCHCCKLACQEKMLKTFCGWPDYISFFLTYTDQNHHQDKYHLIISLGIMRPLALFWCLYC